MIPDEIIKKLKRYPLTFVVLLAAMAMNCGKITTLSNELLGTWKTSNISYSGTFFELKKDVIVFGSKDGDVNTYRILEVKKQKMENNEWDSYIIFYQDNDFHRVEFSFFYRSTGTPVIRFKNQPVLVWKKETQVKT